MLYVATAAAVQDLSPPLCMTHMEMDAQYAEGSGLSARPCPPPPTHTHSTHTHTPAHQQDRSMEVAKWEMALHWPYTKFSTGFHSLTPPRSAYQPVCGLAPLARWLCAFAAGGWIRGRIFCYQIRVISPSVLAAVVSRVLWPLWLRTHSFVEKRPFGNPDFIILGPKTLAHAPRQLLARQRQVSIPASWLLRCAGSGVALGDLRSS